MARLLAGPLLAVAPLAFGALLACGPAAAQSDTTPSAQNEYRIQQLEDQIRSLTGQVETQSHQIELLTQQLEKMRSDTDLRLNDLEGKAGGGQPAQAAGQQDSSSAPTAAAPAPAPQADQSAGAPTPLYPGAGAQPGPGAPPRDLGTIPAGDVPTVGPDQEAELQAATTPQGQYRAAYALIEDGRFADAERAFRAFLQQYPRNPLASSAAYWVGHSYYARGDFQNASVAFADGYKKYPSGIKAPDTLLDLGRSLAKLGNTQDACATLAQFDRQFGVGALPAIKRQEQQEKARLRCG
jgi:tol-pal system protein YbgF